MSLALALVLLQFPQATSRQLDASELAAPATCTTFVGRVLSPRGRPARGARVATSAGGEAVTDGEGAFELVADVPADARFVDVTAVTRAGLTASARVLPASLSAVTSLGALVVSSGTGVRARWLPTFGGFAGVDGAVLSMAEFDDGGGPALYVAGNLSVAGGTRVADVARWDGRRWSALGEGVTGTSVNSLAVFDDGGGPALYAAGEFTVAGGLPAARIARWDGASWSSLGSGIGGTVRTIAVFDDGSGDALYATGTFTTAGGVPANGIARWDGASWSALGGGITGGVATGRALAVFDDGGGDALYVGGDFTTAGGVPASRIARWDGASWSALGAGTDKAVYALCVYDPGSGPALYAGGRLESAGGVAASRIARWNGASWSRLGSGVSAGRIATAVHALLVFDSGGGPRLHVAGDFSSAGGLPVRGAARWNGTSWAGAGNGAGDNFIVNALATFDRGDGPELHAGGIFSQAGALSPSNVARLEGAQWAELGDGPSGRVSSLLRVESGGDVQLIAGGRFTSMGGVPANHVARWDGTTWHPLGGGITLGSGPLYFPNVMSLALYDDGGGPDLYVGGEFEVAGGLQAPGIARWDGAQWSHVGPAGVYHGYPNAMIVFDDGNGSSLYLGSMLTPWATRWNGTSWAIISNGMNGEVRAFAVFDDGNGPALYAGGAFTNASGGPVNHVARWTGAGWAPLGGGTPMDVHALAVFDDGNGPALYASGGDDTSIPATVASLMRWDGASWSTVGSGFTPADVQALATLDDGSGPALYAVGGFYTADGLAANQIARWDGASWSTLGAGLFSGGEALAQFEHGGVPAVLVGGGFRSSPARDSYLATWSVGSKVRRSK